jgi:hypothetical protein
MRPFSIKRGVVAVLGAAAVGTMTFFLSNSARAHHDGDSGFLPLSISINQLMVEMVDDVAHNIWDGGNKTTPLTNEEWQVVQEHGTQLQAAATLISMGGSGPMDHNWAGATNWQDYARQLKDVGAAAKTAAASKDKMALWKAGDQMVTVCEGCHRQFKPDLPTEGRLHQGHGHKVSGL